MAQTEQGRYRFVLLWFIVALLAVQTLAGALMLQRQQHVRTEVAMHATQNELDLIENLVLEPLLRHDYSTIIEFLEGWGRQNPEIRRLRAIAANGFVFADYAAAGEQDGLTLSRQLVHDGRPLATLILVRDFATVREHIAELRLQMLIGGVLVTTLLGATLWLVLSRLGLRPLEREILRRQAVEAELREHRDHLDELVTQRTQALEQANAALRESEARWRSLVENAPDYVLGVDADLHIRFANRTPEGIPHESWVGARLCDLAMPEQRPMTSAAVSRVLLSQQPEMIETCCIGPHGRPTWFNVHIGPVVQDGKVQSLTLISRDITERKQAEAALREKSEHLELVNEELQQLIYVIAHDLKGPLRAVSHLSTIMAEEFGQHLPESGQPLLEKMRSRVQRMHALIEALLDYSRVGRAGVTERVDCRELVLGIIDTYPAPEGFTFTTDDPLPVFETDRLHLRQALANLIGNAIVHHDRPDGTVHIASRDLGNGFFEFEVSDDGPGIPADYREKVFGMFQTLENRRYTESTGIGLTLVKKIVESRGGSISLDSRGERGTTVRFTWPKEEPEAAAAA